MTSRLLYPADFNYKNNTNLPFGLIQELKALSTDKE